MALGAGATWGTTGPLSTGLYDLMPATSIGFWRVLIGTVALAVWGIMFRRDLFRADRRGWLLVGLGGGAMVALFEIAYQFAIGGASLRSGEGAVPRGDRRRAADLDCIGNLGPAAALAALAGGMARLARTRRRLRHRREPLVLRSNEADRSRSRIGGGHDRTRDRRIARTAALQPATHRLGMARTPDGGRRSRRRLHAGGIEKGPRTSLTRGCRFGPGELTAVEVGLAGRLEQAVNHELETYEKQAAAKQRG